MSLKPIEVQRQPYFRKHYPKEYSCQCGKKLNSKWLFCPYCGREIDWGINICGIGENSGKIGCGASSHVRPQHEVKGNASGVSGIT